MSDRARVLRIARRWGHVTTREAVSAGIHRETLRRLVREGILETPVRGQYRIPGMPVTEHHGLALVAAAVPQGVVCLLSALSFHDIGTQIPPDVWLAIERRSRCPRLPYPPLRVVRFSGDAFTEGIEVHRIEGRPVRVYGVAKTIADCFKYRNKIGLDVALEALREAWRGRRMTMDELDHYAGVCRVRRVLRPYIEALVA